MEKNSEDIGNGVVFYGFRKSKILLDKKLKRWTIISLDNDTKILELADEARLPIGPKEWIVPKDICRDGS